MSMKNGKAKYIPVDEDIIKEVVKLSKGQKSVLIFCSSGGWNGLIARIKKILP